MAGVGQAAGIDAVGEGFVDRVADRHATQRNVARVHALGEGEQVRHHVVVRYGEPFSGAAESGHDLVGDEDDAVLVAQARTPVR